MPEELKRKIRASWTHSDKREHEKIWVTCAGENPADQENIGAVNIYPTLGFPAYYFPYTNVEGYLPPLVAVQFSKPKSKFTFELLYFSFTKRQFISNSSIIHLNELAIHHHYVFS